MYGVCCAIPSLFSGEGHETLAEMSITIKTLVVVVNVWSEEKAMTFDNSGTNAFCPACLGTTTKGLNYHFPSLRLNRLYVVEKLSISEP